MHLHPPVPALFLPLYVSRGIDCLNRTLSCMFIQNNTFENGVDFIIDSIKLTNGIDLPKKGLQFRIYTNPPNLLHTSPLHEVEDEPVAKSELLHPPDHAHSSLIPPKSGTQSPKQSPKQSALKISASNGQHDHEHSPVISPKPTARSTGHSNLHMPHHSLSTTPVRDRHSRGDDLDVHRAHSHWHLPHLPHGHHRHPGPHTELLHAFHKKGEVVKGHVDGFICEK